MRLLRSSNFQARITPLAWLFGRADFYAPLTHSIVPTNGPAPNSCTRASTAYAPDNEGIYREYPVDGARFPGARVVRNRATAPTNTLAVSASNTTTFANAGTVTFSMGAGTGTATFSGTGGATGTLNASASGRVEVTKTITAGTFIVTASVADLVDIQVEKVDGQADQTASEYVSSGVLSFPFHGLGAGGIKAFTTNKDGTSIPDASLKGYLREDQRTNAALWGSDFTNAAWVKTNVNAALNATDNRGIPNAASTLTASANGGTALQSIALSGTRAMSVFVKRGTGTGTIEFTHDGTTWTNITSSLSASSFYRARLENKAVSNPHSIGFRFGTSGDSIIACVVMDEDGPTVASPIFTASVAVTRSADTGIQFNRGSILVDNAGTVYARWGVDTGESTYLLITQSVATDSNGRVFYASITHNTTYGYTYDGVSVSFSAGYSRTNGSLQKQVTCWSGSSGGPNAGLRTITYGASSPSNTAAYDGTMGAASTFTIGATGCSRTRDVYLWANRAVTDAQMVELVK